MIKKTIIKSISAIEILDSRGNPTIEAEVLLADGSVGVVAVPSGASTGTHEAVELRDGGKRYSGNGVLKAVENVNKKINKLLKGEDALKQRELDRMMIELDGTENKGNLGANSILSVSLALARACAQSKKVPLYKYIRSTFKLQEKVWRMPVPTMNVLNGGRHADNGLSVQEFMLVPIKGDFAEKVRIGSEVFHALKVLLKEKKLSIAVGDEGGFAPKLTFNEEALKLLMKAISNAGYKPGKDVMLASDIAASEFYKGGKYFFSNPHSGISAEEMTKILIGWLRKYPFISLEDPFAEDDWENWAKFTNEVGKKVIIIGDDLFVTNVERLKKGIEEKVGNAILIKLNQIGSLSETIDAIYLAKKNKYKISVSHRSGETCDTFIADLAVAVNADFIKTGSLSRSERVEKYNRLMKIESELK
ncbi:MAG: phosphopyruvate hydratase [Candidatus Magasanikbacteria bacterium CG_4_9_14_3_um_filter_32_9]|uniref:Enolase n=1 Tax=Candidatus Magasanikbacteria bacterium CG_4_9_14_3_um_filter_32_9 TaxID=1974644 RepID=A0A2M7Z707_9BACT|nr:MAG: phosphopyruvate hydratase [Candidatus Magasanikbacteria bacterium CG_4_9_14_3_um_filter_32_9]